MLIFLSNIASRSIVIRIIHFDFSLGAEPDADTSGGDATAASPPNPADAAATLGFSEIPVTFFTICSVVLLIHSSTIFSNSKYCDIISLSCSIRVFISSGSKHISTDSTISFKIVSSILGILSLTNSLSCSSSFFI